MGLMGGLGLWVLHSAVLSMGPRHGHWRERRMLNAGCWFCPLLGTLQVLPFPPAARTLSIPPLNQSPAAAVRGRHTSAGLEDDGRLTLQSGFRSLELSPRAPVQLGLGHVFPGLREGPAPFLASKAAFFLGSRPICVESQQSHHLP